MKSHYVYRITNKVENKHYYGCRTSKVPPIEDIGVKYFSSSKDKDFIAEQKVSPEKFKYKVISTFKTRKEALNMEIKLHEKFDVAKNDKFYNKAKQTSSGWDTSGFIFSDEMRKKIGDRTRGTSLSEEHKDKIRKSLLGRKHTNEAKRKMSESLKGNIPWNKGVPMSEEVKKKMSERFTGEGNNRYGTKHTKETLEKMRKPKPKVKCPHCGKVGGISSMKRWHFDNCKEKENKC